MLPIVRWGYFGSTNALLRTSPPWPIVFERDLNGQAARLAVVQTVQTVQMIRMGNGSIPSSVAECSATPPEWLAAQ